MVWTLLLACPAEQLGIDLPPGGAEAISHEDLRRDTRMFVDGPAVEKFLERTGQMQLVPAAAPAGLPSGTTCAARGEGPGPGAPRLLVSDADTATAAAALISVAKAWDLDGGPKGHATVCLLPSGADPAAVAAALGPEALVVGPLAAGEATFTPGAGHAATFAADPADPAREAGRVNFTELQGRVKRLYARL